MKEKHIFSNKELWALLIPVMVEQLLTSLMGTVDTIMVSNVGSEAISAVSLVDAINVLVIQAFAALAAGGTIICSQYLGRTDKKNAENAASQVVLSTVVLSLLVTMVCLAVRTPLLRLIFGAVEPEVMRNSEIYFFYTALSFPFIALFNSGSAIFRAQKNTRTPMTISVTSNFMNIGGNAFLIWGMHMGVAGAAIATLASRVFCAVMVMYCLRKPRYELTVRDYRRIRPDWSCIRRVLSVGIPSGVENSMFQFGKLAIQSTVSTLGTVAIAAQAMTNILEGLNGICVMGVGMGMMTVVGQCIGAGREDEAVYYIKKLSVWSEFIMIANCLVVFAATKPITILGGMEAESARMCFEMMLAITIYKPIAWVCSFVPAYGMRAAGDVKFSMIVTCVSMWLCRVSLAVVLCRFTDIGPMGVWVAMFTDWTVRGFIFLYRFHSRKWLRHRVIE
ncbi:MAG: MATE family efflux transporter [Lachnospiraceae bacterium]|nr:MATE family efflux transporter [Lachnospiraceae bacterium]